MALTRATDKIIANADGNLNLSGIVTASLAPSGDLNVGNNIKLGTASGIITATSFSGDGSNLTSLPAGLGTALSSTQTSPLNKLYYTNEILSIGATVTVDHPSTGTGAYTQYTDIRLEEGADLIIEDGDDVIPDILGLGTDGGGLGAGGGGRIRVDSITNKNANGAPNFPNGLTGTAGTFTGSINAASGTITGVVTATSFVGSGANLTSLPAANLTGTLPAIDGSNLTGVGASFGNSSINTSGIITATSFVPTTGQLSHRNIIINGDMRVAQRGTSSTTTNGYTLDRYKVQLGGHDEVCTIEQANVASGTTPYTLGFLKCLKITNGNQTSVNASDFLEIYQYLEDQDICNSGWNFKSSSSYLTISFWIKSSVAQKFAGFFYTNTAGQGDSYMYSYQIDNGSGGNLSADTWTKITHSIPGNSSLTFNNDNTRGLAVGIFPYDGTTYTTSGHTENTWAGWNSSNKLKDMDSTWWTTNDATFEITGLQLEVGPVATPFEHLSFAENKRRCMRYYQQYANIMSVGYVPNNTSKSYSHGFNFPVEMRAAPTLTISNTGSTAGQYVNDGDTNRNVSSLNSHGSQTYQMEYYFNLSGDLADYRGAYAVSSTSTTHQTTYYITAEL